MERTDRAGLATFFAADEPLHQGATLSLGPSVVRHLRALRQGPGHAVRLTDGAGRQATGSVVRLSHETVTIEVSHVEDVAPLPPIHLLVPIGDRERMLWLAEKVTELGVTTWRPVLWRHSKSVRPRGEGSSFALKARARMISALEQSRGAYLPLAHPEAPPERAVAAVPEGRRIMLDPAGTPLLSHAVEAPVTLALGPEGGLDPKERGLLEASGFVPASLGASILRFETAAVAAVAIVRAAFDAHRGVAHVD